MDVAVRRLEGVRQLTLYTTMELMIKGLLGLVILLYLALPLLTNPFRAARGKGDAPDDAE